MEGNLRALRQPRDRDEKAAARQERSRLYPTGELRDGEGPVGGVEEERPDQEQDRGDPGDEERHQRRSPRLLLVAVGALGGGGGGGGGGPEKGREGQGPPPLEEKGR